MKLVRTPVPGVNDTVGTVVFRAGVAKVDDAATELHYFRTAGYGIEDYDEVLEAALDNENADPAIADALDEIPAQAGHQEDDPQILLDVDGDGVQTVLPRKSASTETWRLFAVDHGMHEDEAKAMTRDELVAHFTADEDADGDKQEEAL